MNKNNLELYSPWERHRQKLEVMFSLDEQVTVGEVERIGDDYAVTVKVSSHTKAVALEKLLASPEFGNVKLSVIVEDTAQEETPADILRAAFAYNRAIRSVEVKTDSTTGTKLTYLVTEPNIFQFQADNLADYRGNESLLAADVVREAITIGAGTSVCTADLRED